MLWKSKETANYTRIIQLGLELKNFCLTKPVIIFVFFSLCLQHLKDYSFLNLIFSQYSFLIFAEKFKTSPMHTCSVHRLQSCSKRDSLTSPYFPVPIIPWYQLSAFVDLEVFCYVPVNQVKPCNRGLPQIMKMQLKSTPIIHLKLCF